MFVRRVSHSGWNSKSRKLTRLIFRLIKLLGITPIVRLGASVFSLFIPFYPMAYIYLMG